MRAECDAAEPTQAVLLRPEDIQNVHTGHPIQQNPNNYYEKCILGKRNAKPEATEKHFNRYARFKTPPSKTKLPKAKRRERFYSDDCDSKPQYPKQTMADPSGHSSFHAIVGILDDFRNMVKDRDLTPVAAEELINLDDYIQSIICSRKQELKKMGRFCEADRRELNKLENIRKELLCHYKINKVKKDDCRSKKSKSSHDSKKTKSSATKAKSPKRLRISSQVDSSDTVETFQQFLHMYSATIKGKLSGKARSPARFDAVPMTTSSDDSLNTKTKASNALLAQYSTRLDDRIIIEFPLMASTQRQATNAQMKKPKTMRMQENREVRTRSPAVSHDDNRTRRRRKHSGTSTTATATTATTSSTPIIPLTVCLQEEVEKQVGRNKTRKKPIRFVPAHYAVTNTINYENASVFTVNELIPEISNSINIKQMHSFLRMNDPIQIQESSAKGVTPVSTTEESSIHFNDSDVVGGLNSSNASDNEGFTEDRITKFAGNLSVNAMIPMSSADEEDFERLESHSKSPEILLPTNTSTMTSSRTEEKEMPKPLNRKTSKELLQQVFQGDHYDSDKSDSKSVEMIEKKKRCGNCCHNSFMPDGIVYDKTSLKPIVDTKWQLSKDYTRFVSVADIGIQATSSQDECEELSIAQKLLMARLKEKKECSKMHSFIQEMKTSFERPQPYILPIRPIKATKEAVQLTDATVTTDFPMYRRLNGVNENDGTFETFRWLPDLVENYAKVVLVDPNAMSILTPSNVTELKTSNCFRSVTRPLDIQDTCISEDDDDLGSSQMQSPLEETIHHHSKRSGRETKKKEMHALKRLNRASKTNIRSREPSVAGFKQLSGGHLSIQTSGKLSYPTEVQSQDVMTTPDEDITSAFMLPIDTDNSRSETTFDTIYRKQRKKTWKYNPSLREEISSDRTSAVGENSITDDITGTLVPDNLADRWSRKHRQVLENIASFNNKCNVEPASSVRWPKMVKNKVKEFSSNFGSLIRRRLERKSYKFNINIQRRNFNQRKRKLNSSVNNTIYNTSNRAAANGGRNLRHRRRIVSARKLCRRRKKPGVKKGYISRRVSFVKENNKKSLDKKGYENNRGLQSQNNLAAQMTPFNRIPTSSNPVSVNSRGDQADFMEDNRLGDAEFENNRHRAINLWIQPPPQDGDRDYDKNEANVIPCNIILDESTCTRSLNLQCEKQRKNQSLENRQGSCKSLRKPRASVVREHVINTTEWTDSVDKESLQSDDSSRSSSNTTTKHIRIAIPLHRSKVADGNQSALHNTKKATQYRQTSQSQTTCRSQTKPYSSCGSSMSEDTNSQTHNSVTETLNSSEKYGSVLETLYELSSTMMKCLDQLQSQKLDAKINGSCYTKNYRFKP